MSEQLPEPDRDMDKIMDAAMAASLRPEELSSGRRNAMRERIVTRARGAAAPAGTKTIRAHEGEWQPVVPGVTRKILREDPVAGNQTALWRVEPGAEFPPHSHSQEEECLVLEGEITVGEHVVRAGDMHYAYAGCDHPVIGSRTGALLLVRSEIGAA